MLEPPFKQNRFLVFLIHWLAWLMLHFIVYLPALINTKKITWSDFLYTHVFLVTINFLLFYIVAFYIMPLVDAFLRKWFWILIASLLLAILFTYLKFRIELYHANYFLRIDPLVSKFSTSAHSGSTGFFSDDFGSYLQFNILTNVSVVVIGFAYRLLLIWFQQEKIRTELQNQKLSAELSFLKMQVNPHFLFNALNNIYSLSVLENAKSTSDSILKLSDLTRYILYEKEDSENKVSLDKEIHHINNYIDLEKLRHPDNMYINFSIEGEIDGKRIAPLLLFPLIENSFKHGLLTDPNKPLNIQLKIGTDRMTVLIDNYKNAYQKDKVGGIGISNVKKRLDLLYGDSYELHVDNTKDRYIVNLNLPL